MRMRQLVVLGCVVSAFAACGSVANTASPATTTTTVPALPACVLPPLRAPSPKNPQFDLTGPAVSALHGGAARAGFALDAGAFTMTPPRPGDRPGILPNAAECAALASISPNGLPVLQLAAGGIAVGYGLVSVSPRLIATTPSTAYVEHSGTDHNTNPKLPRPAAYQHRLAWLVVVQNNEVFFGSSGPPRPPGATTTTSPRRASNGYLVFLVDARTGSDALLYEEGRPGPVTSAGSPSVTVPAEQISVPWTLESRSPNGYEARITATVLPCDGIPNPVTTERGRAALAVIVRRPVGTRCGAPKQVGIALHAAVVTFNLPAHIAHDPLGPEVTPESGATPGYTARCPQTRVDGRLVIECYYDGPGATGGVLRSLFEPDNGTTIRVKVGSVLAVGPLHDAHRYAALPVASSDPKTLGSLFPDIEVHEFRAWHAGHADLLVPTAACNPPKGLGAPCTPPWIVHVDIT